MSRSARQHNHVRAILIALLLAAAIVLGAGPPDATSARADTAAVAINDQDGSSVFELAFDVRRVAGEVVDEQNTAVAYANCESCRTVAISIQIVIVLSEPDVVTPQNVAVAINEACTLCETFAAAYQFVIGGQPLRLTGQGRRQIADIRRRLGELGASDLSLDELSAQLGDLVSELQDVLNNSLVPIRDDDQDDEDEIDDDEDEIDDADEDESEPGQPSTTPTTTTPTTTAPTTTTPTTTTTTPTTTTTTTTPATEP